MRKVLAIAGALLGLLWANSSYALDSYRFLHVTIETPWTIAMFLVVMVLAPVILMTVLVWRYSARKAESGKKESAQVEANK